jgi:hypothetical protein
MKAATEVTAHRHRGYFRNRPLLLAAILFVQSPLGAQWQSALVRTENGRLVYGADSLGNRIPDFSYAGFRNGGVPLPTAAVVQTIGPAAGDNTLRIQMAIDEVAALAPGPDGIRGALLLEAGVYRVSGTLRVNASGVVLRGAGDGSDTTQNTVILATGDVPHQRSVIVAGGGTMSRWVDRSPGVSQQDIVTDTVFTGAASFAVADASQYAIGDNIIITHPCTDAWLQAIDYGGSHSGEPGSDASDVPWAVNSQPVVYNRNITAKNGTTITIDVPVYYTLIRGLSQSTIYRYARTNLRTMIGIEHLRVDIETGDSTSNPNGNENHAWNAFELTQVEDAWVRYCTALHFGHSGFITNTATRVTIEDCKALDPVSIITGERRYNFNVYTASQQMLFRRCDASNGRHHFVSNGTSLVSGCVFTDCTSSGAYASSEGHRRWSQALLYDAVTEIDGPRPSLSFAVGLYNRGYYGTSHGWAAVNSVLWNYSLHGGTAIVQRPPTAQNFSIGATGTVAGIKPPAPFNHPAGFIEGTNQPGLTPRSLHQAQLQDRLSPTHVETTSPGLRPSSLSLDSYPNPFNPVLTVEFSVRTRSTVRVKVFDQLGKAVTELYAGVALPGTTYRRQFLAEGAASGIYYIRLESDTEMLTRRVVLVR